LRHGSACCNPSNGGKVRGKRHGPKGSQVRIMAQTNVSLERSLFKFMKDKKYQTIHMSHVGSILQITSIRINIFKVCLHINSNKRPLTTSSKNDSRHNTHLRLIRANSNMPLFRGWLLHYVDTSKTSICEDKLRLQIRLSISDIYCCVVICS
jgi:hypothetical protein